MLLFLLVRLRGRASGWGTRSLRSSCSSFLRLCSQILGSRRRRAVLGGDFASLRLLLSRRIALSILLGPLPLSFQSFSTTTFFLRELRLVG